MNRLTKKLDVEEEVERQAVEERQQGIRRQGRSVMSLEPGQLSTVENIEVRSLNEVVSEDFQVIYICTTNEKHHIFPIVLICHLLDHKHIVTSCQSSLTCQTCC